MNDVRTNPDAPLDTQVVVVGAGPVGLLLAGELRLGGAEVMVLERLTEPSQESRATTLHARTMELFDQRGLLERIGPTPPRDPRGHFGGIPMDLGGVESPYAGQWKVPQTRTCEVLREWASALGAEVRSGHELVGLVQDDDRVLAVARTAEGRTLRISASYLVGCDGEDSAVRRLAGVEFPGADATRELLRADVAGIDVPDRRFERFPAGLAIAGRRPDGVTRVMVHRFGRPAVHRAAAPEFAEVAAAWREVTGEDIGAGTPLWLNAFGDARRQAARYRAGRVLLAGDAAHVQMPVGGQALNLGLQDAMNLGWKLAAEVTGRAAAGLLDTYHDERHAVGRQVLGNIAAQSAVLLGGDEVADLRAVLAELLRHDGAVRHLAGRISGVDLRPAAGPSDRPWSGARLAPAELVTGPGAVTTTAELLRPGRGLLLDVDPDAPGHARLRAQAALWADRVRVVVATAAPDSEPARLGAVLVRPDGHVVWARPEGHEAAVGALHRWFGSPRTPDAVARAGRRTTPGGAQAAPAAGRTAPAPTVTSVLAPRSRRQKMGTLENRTALVTGSSRGIGRAVAERLAAERALVVVHYARAKEAAEDTVNGIRAAGGRAFAVRAPLGAAGDVDALFDGVEEGLKEHTGGVELDIVVNNAGIMGGVSPEDTTPEIFDRLMAVNAKAPFFVIQRALRTMRDGGRIINITSGLTRFANPEEIAYAMTKGAVETLARHYAKHLAGRGITVNSVAPGVTNNGGEIFDNPQAVEFMAQLSAFGRVGEPTDIADVVAFLASDASRWITGAFIDATGGTLL
ncbi:SDR family oxidoreductase [Streptomyces sp. NPDC048514]|uniref:SDR family oxidoreductase n=1 Tax=Streptomyces sp. NPDC048514 TaxID=3365564 RepID=UPI00371B348C